MRRRSNAIRTRGSFKPPPISLARLLRAFAGYAGFSVAGQLVGFIALVVAARRLGPTAVGAYTFAASVTTYFLLPTNFGFNTVAIRDVATQKQSLASVAREMIALQIGAALVMYGVLAGSAVFIAPSGLTRAVLLIVGLQLLTNALALDWALQSIGRLGIVGAWRLLSQLVYLPLVLITVRSPGDAALFAGANVAGYLFFAIGTIASIWRQLRPSDAMSALRLPSPARIWSRVRRSLPVGYAMAMGQVYYYFDAILLQYVRGSASVGVYGVAYRLPLAYIGVAGLWTTAVMPYTARLGVGDRQRLARDVGAVLSASCVIAAATVGYATIWGPELIPFIFGPKFASGATAFSILMVAAALVLIGVGFAPVLIGIGQAGAFARAATIGAIVNVVLNVVLIPEFGIVGAACATVAAEASAVGTCLILLIGAVGKIPFARGRAVMTVAAAVVCAAVPTLIRAADHGVGTTPLLACSVALLAVTLRALGVGNLIASCATTGGP